MEMDRKILADMAVNDPQGILRRSSRIAKGE